MGHAPDPLHLDRIGLLHGTPSHVTKYDLARLMNAFGVTEDGLLDEESASKAALSSPRTKKSERFPVTVTRSANHSTNELAPLAISDFHSVIEGTLSNSMSANAEVHDGKRSTRSGSMRKVNDS